MRGVNRNMAVLALLVVTGCAVARPAEAQVTATTQAAPRALGPADFTSAPLVNYPQFVNPGFVPGWPGYFQTPLNGYLTGVASVTQANADYQVTIQQAKLAQEQARQAALDTRRKTLDQARYEQSLMPNPEELRQRAILEAINRSRNNPPATEIWSGKALNDLFTAIKMGHLQGLRGPIVPLDQQLLRRINLTDGTTRGSVGPLRDGGKLRWPLPLTGPTFKKSRDRLDELAVQAFNQGSSGGIADETIAAMRMVVRQLDTEVSNAVKELTPDEYIQSMRFVRQMRDTVQTLQNPNVANFFSNKWTPQGNTVGELVAFLAGNGLSFAPAAPGDEPAYTVLYNNLLAYDQGLAQFARR
jgi:hypothetical protein